MRSLTVRAMEGCPLKTAMILICDCWKVTLIQALLDANSSLRYSELRDAAGEISDRTHTRQLRELTDDGLVIREVYPEVPPRVEYALTPTARRLEPIFAEHQTWGGFGSEFRARAARRSLPLGCLGRRLPSRRPR